MAQERSLEVAGGDSSAPAERGTRERVIAEIMKLVRPQHLTNEELRKYLDSEFVDFSLKPSHITVEELADAVLKATNHESLVVALKNTATALQYAVSIIEDKGGDLLLGKMRVTLEYARATLSRCEETQ